MEEKLYSVADSACKKASEYTGMSIKFPKPGKRAWEVSAVLNGTVGAGLLLFGCLSPYKWVLALGALGVAGAVIAGRNANR